jgi:TRAP-type transport system periplasmic protein
MTMCSIGRKLSALIGGLTIAAAVATAASAQQFTMKLSQPTINDITHEFFKRLKAGVEQRSNGRIKVEIYPANQLGQIPAVVEGVALGTIEVGVAASGFFVSLEPRFQVLDGPGLFDDVPHAYRVFSDPEIRARIATFGADKGVEILVPGVYSPLAVLSHSPIRKVTDFQGLKIRTPGGAAIQVEPFRKLGIIPVSLPLGDSLPAMQNRTIDGIISGLTVFTNFKYFDIAKAVTYLPATTLLAPAVINRQFLKRIGPELETIVREEARKAELAYGEWNVEENKRGEEVWRRNGGELIMLPQAEAKRYLEAVEPITKQILSATPKLKEDHEALLAAAAKYRR